MPPSDPFTTAYYTNGFAYEDPLVTNKNPISFHINSPQRPKAGEKYTNTDSFLYNASLIYINGSGVIYTIGTLSDARRSTANTTIEFESFDDRACKGRFSGTVYNYQDINDSVFIRGKFSFKD